MISTALLDRVQAKLAVPRDVNLDLAGLNAVYGAYCGAVPNDNIHKRIWLTGNKFRPVTGGDPTEFFENWLQHGTGGTCFPSNGALCELLCAFGFDAWRILGSVRMEGIEQGGNHGTVLVQIAEAIYMVDAQLASFSALPLMQGQVAFAGEGIHRIRALPKGSGFDVEWFPGSNRQTPMSTYLELERGRVAHEVFLAHYALSALAGSKRSPFNEALFVGRRFPDRILNVGRLTRTEILADNVPRKRQLTDAERTQILVGELGLSAEIVEAIPPDEESA